MGTRSPSRRTSGQGSASGRTRSNPREHANRGYADIRYERWSRVHRVSATRRTPSVVAMRSRRDRFRRLAPTVVLIPAIAAITLSTGVGASGADSTPVSYTHLRAHETVLDLVCR